MRYRRTKLGAVVRSVLLALVLLVPAVVAAPTADAQFEELEGSVSPGLELWPNAELSNLKNSHGDAIISDPDSLRFLDADNASQGWSVRHAQEQNHSAQLWGSQAANSFLQANDAKCTAASPLANPFGVRCEEDRLLLGSAVRTGAVDVIAIFTDFSNERRWLHSSDASAGHSVGTVDAQTTAANPHAALWMIVPASTPTSFYVINVDSGRYLTRGGGPSVVSTRVTPAARAEWSFKNLFIRPEPPQSRSQSLERLVVALDLDVDETTVHSVPANEAAQWLVRKYDAVATEVGSTCTASIGAPRCNEDAALFQQMAQIGATDAIALHHAGGYLTARGTTHQFDVVVHPALNATNRIWLVVPVADSDDFKLRNLATRRWMSLDATGTTTVVNEADALVLSYFVTSAPFKPALDGFVNFR